MINGLKNIFSHLKGIIERIALLLIWLIVLDACTKFDDVVGITLGMLSLMLFLFFHVKLKQPRGWHSDRLLWVKPSYIPLLLLITILLVLGDVFWIYHVNTSADVLSNEGNSLDFLVLAILVFPVIEEFGFRLWLQGYMETFIKPILAIFIVSFAFGFMHRPDMPIPQILAGLFYGILLVETRSIWVPVSLHIMQNALLIISGELEYVQRISIEMMDKQGNINFSIAISIWALSSVLIVMWCLLNKKLSKGDRHGFQ